MAGTSEENIRKIGIVDRCWDNTNDRQKYQQCTVSRHTSICKVQQQINERLWFKYKVVILHILGCQQLVWVGDVTNFASGWFQMEMITVTKGAYLNLIFSILKSYTSYTAICDYYSEEWKSIIVRNFCVISVKKNYLIHIKALKEVLDPGLIPLKKPLPIGQRNSADEGWIS